MIKRLIIAAILLVLVAGGLVGFNLFRDRAIRQFFANMPVPTVTVSAAEAKAITWTPHIEAIGTVNAARGVDLTVETAGVVKTIHFEANERVSKGQFLLQLDDAVQRADLEAARAQAALDQQSLERARELQKRGVSTSVTVDTAETTASASQSQVAKLEAVLEQKRLQAPFDGTVGIRRVDVGQYLTPGTVVATMQDLDNMYADFTVPEQQRNSLKIGQPVKLGVSADDMPFSGELIGIDPKVDPATRLVSVRARYSNPVGRLSPG
ncbi:MAG: efflux RND transporter periplasmic adaptor subunit, partial [Flavobacteriaceae bacterium]